MYIGITYNYNNKYFISSFHYFSFFLNFHQDGVLNPLFIIGLLELIIIIYYVRIIFSKMLRYMHNMFKHHGINLW